MKQKAISIVFTAALILGVGIAMYQSATDRIEDKLRKELSSKQFGPEKETKPLAVHKKQAGKSRFPGRVAKGMFKPALPPVPVQHHAHTNKPQAHYFNDKLSPITTLHAIGVYEWANDSGKTAPPWWSKCRDLSDPNAMAECHRKYAGHREQQSIDVYVSYTDGPVILALMAYNPISWHLHLEQGVTLEGVILAGYHSQNITGTPSGLPIIAFTYNSPGCARCERGDGHFYAYKKGDKLQKAEMKLLEITGKGVSSFQGAYRANRFYITNNS